MMRFFAFSLGLLSLAVPLSARPSSSVEIFEKLPGVPREWTQVSWEKSRKPAR